MSEEIKTTESVKTSVKFADKVATTFRGIKFGVKKDNSKVLYTITFNNKFSFIDKGEQGLRNELSFTYKELLYHFSNANGDFCSLVGQLKENIHDGYDEDDNTFKLGELSQIFRLSSVTLRAEFHAKGEVKQYSIDDETKDYIYPNDYLDYTIEDIVLTPAGEEEWYRLFNNAMNGNLHKNVE